MIAVFPERRGGRGASRRRAFRESLPADGAAGQVRIEDGGAFDLDGGLGLDLSGDLEFLSLQLTQAGDLRSNMRRGIKKRKIVLSEC